MRSDKEKERKKNENMRCGRERERERESIDDSHFFSNINIKFPFNQD